MKAKQITSLESLIQQLKSNKNYKQAIKYGTNNYNVTQYKINKVKLQEISELVNLIELNYVNFERDNDQLTDKKKYPWLANQLKLFIWIAVCHSFLIQKPLEQYEENEWTFFTSIFSTKTSNDLDFQIKSVFKNYHGNKEKWEPQEQELLKLIVEDEENKNKWNQVSRLLYFRSNKKYYRSSQKCRQHWFNYLDPSLNKKPWSVEQDLRLVKQLQTYGYKWSKLTQVIESRWGYRRTEHMVKNRTKLLCKKYGFKEDKEQSSMKQLRRIEKKLIEEKLKSDSSVVYIKYQQQSDSKSHIYQNQNNQSKQLPNNQSKNQIPQHRNIHIKPNSKKKIDSSQGQRNKTIFDSESSSSDEDFEDRYKHHIKLSKMQQNRSKQDKYTNKRNVIILYHVDHDHQKQLVHNQQPELIEQQESPEIIIGQLIQQPILNEEQNQEELVYFDQYKIIEEVPQGPKIDLNEQIQFEHHTHGGTMRERVTHELAKFFPTPQNQIIPS